MNQKELKLIMDDVRSFPSMPAAALKLMTLLKDENASTAQIEPILRYEPGLTANILKLTNSSYYGLSSKIGSIRQAVLLLGWKKLIQIVVAYCASAIVDKPVQGYDLPSGELWRHSIAVSVAAELLIKELKLSVSEEILTAALLHDIGKLVLGRYLKDDIEMMGLNEMPGVPFEHIERSMFGIDHAEVGANILRNWSFPTQMISAVRWHHEPDSGTESNLMIDVVHVADVLCLMIGIGVGREGLQYQPSPDASTRLGLNQDIIEKVASQTLQLTNELSASFQNSQ